MTRSIKKPRTARARGNWPELEGIGRADPTVPVTFNIDRSLYDWLAGFVGNYSFFANVEEALITAVRCMAGKDHPHGMMIAELAAMVSDAQGRDIETAMFGSLTEQADPVAVRSLISAAHLASQVGHADLGDLPDDPNEADLVERILAAAGIKLPAVPYDEPLQPEHYEGLGEDRPRSDRFSPDDDIPF